MLREWKATIQSAAARAVSTLLPEDPPSALALLRQQNQAQEPLPVQHMDMPGKFPKSQPMPHIPLSLSAVL